MLFIRRGVVCNAKVAGRRLLSAVADRRLVNIQNAPDGFDASSAVVYPHFITEAEEKAMIEEAGRRLKRRRFEDGHWDAVIKQYREVELPTPDDQFPRQGGVENDDIEVYVPPFVKVIEKTRRHLENHHFNEYSSSNDSIRWLPCHAIDLSANGELTAHVDSVKFSGGIVAGLSLLSDSIMRLKPSAEEWECNEKVDNSNGYVDLYLPKSSLYVLSGMSRYSYTHELLPSNTTYEFMEMGCTDLNAVDNHLCENTCINVIRGRRLSIIFRDAKTVV
jgi:alkylated DNA repair protein alkB family protein 7